MKKMVALMMAMMMVAPMAFAQKSSPDYSVAKKMDEKIQQAVTNAKTPVDWMNDYMRATAKLHSLAVKPSAQPEEVVKAAVQLKDVVVNCTVDDRDFVLLLFSSVKWEMLNTKIKAADNAPLLEVVGDNMSTLSEEEQKEMKAFITLVVFANDKNQSIPSKFKKHPADK